MFTSKDEKLSKEARFFLEPRNATHRQYEALRAYFVDGHSSKDAAARFGYTTGSFRVLCSQFKKDPHRQFFVSAKKKDKSAPRKDPLRDTVITLRKQNLSIYDISEALKKEGKKLSPAAISTILKEEGFTRLPKRRDDERPNTVRPTAADVADVRELTAALRR